MDENLTHKGIQLFFIFIKIELGAVLGAFSLQYIGILIEFEVPDFIINQISISYIFYAAICELKFD
jgi:hypothetical protein